MSGDFKAARADRKPKGYAHALRASRSECPSCWVVGGHDPLCVKVKQAAAMRAKKLPRPEAT